MTGITHIIGAGLAGLSCAIRLCDKGKKVALYEAARLAGGRARSYFDATLGLTIDNGNHLLLSGNRAALDYARRLNTSEGLIGPETCAFDFMDLSTGARWRLRPNDSQLPWWVFFNDRRVPGTRPLDYLDAAKLLFAKQDATIGETMRCQGALYEKLWRPVMLSALNTDPPEASAALAGAILRETLAAGGRACRPLVAKKGLSDVFIEPALHKLAQQAVAPKFGARLKEIVFAEDRVTQLRFAGEEISVSPQDTVVFAAPAWAAEELIPKLQAPNDHRAILNVHFKLTPPNDQPLLLGLVNGLSEWLFAFDDRLSVTISGADRLMETPREALACQVWREVARAIGLDVSKTHDLASDLPPWQIVKEKRAT
ncbi:MAG: FAD-binding protein, partial [Methylocystaceae bacterium]|nr:FAD-binding protein [Methylocystaceae bacterium]